MVSKKVPPDSKGGVVQPVDGLGVPGDSESTNEMLLEVLAKPSNVGKREAPGNKRINGIVIGMLSELGEDGRIMVYYPGIPGGEPLTAISTEDLANQNQGTEVALGFVNGNPAMPIILGLIHKAGEQQQTATNEVTEEQDVDVRLDGEKLTLSAEKEIVLKCGKSSITLTRAGKIIVKGSYLSNHSTGVNRIKGGSVQIN
jgi:hypothetical protein